MSESIMQEEILSQLNNANKIKRRNALNTLNHMLCDDTKHSVSEIHLLVVIFEVPLTCGLSDDSEVNRSKACQILDDLLCRGIKTKTFLSYIMPTLFHQLGKSPVIETCEENRLQYLNLIENIIEVYSSDLQVFANDLSTILTRCLCDNYPDVILKACDCILKLPPIMESKFQMFSSSFVKPLLQCISKHRFKVRVKSINTLECIFTFGNSQDFGEVNNVLAKSCSDIPQVRIALLSYGYTLCMKMNDRYSFWSTILPLVLFGLRDEDKEIRETAKVFWHKIGAQFESENEDVRQRSLLAVPCDERKPDALPDLPSFNEGCIALIQRNFHTMFKKLKENLQDWQVEVRLQAMKLMTVCVYGLCDEGLQYSSRVVDMLLFSVCDNDQRVVDESLLCSSYVGSFTPPALYLPSVTPSLWGQNEGAIHILSAMLKHTPQPSLQKSLHLFTETLSLSNIDRDLSPTEQEEIVGIMHHLVCSCKLDGFEPSFFFTLFAILGSEEVAVHPEVFALAEGVLVEAAKSFGVESCGGFVARYMENCLLHMEEFGVWEEENGVQIRVFKFLSRFEGFCSHLDKIGDLLRKNVDAKKFPLAQFTVLKILEQTVTRIMSSGDRDTGQRWTCYILKEHICEILRLNEGRTGECLRLAALSSLVALSGGGEGGGEVLQALSPCLGYVPSLLTEDVAETRLLTCKFVECFYCTYGGESGEFFGLIKLLSKRLDDDDPRVRQTAAQSLVTCFRQVPLGRKNPQEEQNLEHDLRKLVDEVEIFLKEDDVIVQRSVAELLEILKERLGTLSPPQKKEEKHMKEEKFEQSLETMAISQGNETT